VINKNSPAVAVIGETVATARAASPAQSDTHHYLAQPFCCHTVKMFDLLLFLHATAAVAHLSHCNSVCLSVCLSIRHTGGSVKNGAS